MSDRHSTHQIGHRGVREKLAERVGRPVNAVGFVSPIGNSASGWGGVVGWCAPTDFLTSAVLGVATTGVLGRRNARAAGLPRHLALAVTEHDVHLFRTRMFDHVVGTHVATVPGAA